MAEDTSIEEGFKVLIETLNIATLLKL